MDRENVVMTMQLHDLDPRWVSSTYQHLDEVSGTIVPGHLHVGLSFLCPHCQAERLRVHFSPPIDPHGNPVAHLAAPGSTDGVWQRVSGSSFADLTLAPELGHPACWQGHLVAGELTS
jgi:hypothetical protein